MNLVSNPRLRVVIQLAKDPMRDYYQRELARACNVSIGATNQILRQLARVGLLTYEKRGRMYFYRMNLRNAVARQFKILLSVDSLFSLLSQTAEYARKIILFGSCAEGTDVQDSDIDLLVLTNEKQYVRKGISDFNEKSERKVVSIILDASEFSRMKREDRPLYERIERGLVLWQTE